MQKHIHTDIHVLHKKEKNINNKKEIVLFQYEEIYLVYAQKVKYKVCIWPVNLC